MRSGRVGGGASSASGSPASGAGSGACAALAAVSVLADSLAAGEPDLVQCQPGRRHLALAQFLQHLQPGYARQAEPALL